MISSGDVIVFYLSVWLVYSPAVLPSNTNLSVTWKLAMGEMLRLDPGPASRMGNRTCCPLASDHARPCRPQGFRARSKLWLFPASADFSLVTCGRKRGGHLHTSCSSAPLLGTIWKWVSWATSCPAWILLGDDWGCDGSELGGQTRGWRMAQSLPFIRTIDWPWWKLTSVDWAVSRRGNAETASRRHSQGAQLWGWG